MKLSKPVRWLLVCLCGISLLGVAGVAVLRYKLHTSAGSSHIQLANTLVPIDFTHPDALVLSEKLAALPRDLLKVPLLKATLTEEFAFYYEEQEGRLSLMGTLRRIAYEHHLTFSDSMVQQLLDSPAELALWRGSDGKLDYWMLSLEQNLVTRVLKGLTGIALNDSQLSQLGDLQVDGDTVPLLRLAYGYQRHVVLASHGSRLVILSDAGMLLGYDETPSASEDSASEDSGSDHQDQEPHLLAGQLAHVASALGSDTDDQLALRRQLQLPEQLKGHSLLVSTNYLSFGYQRFFPALQALRFDFDGQSWSSQLLVDGSEILQSWDNAALWRAAPTGPAFCNGLPLEWQAGEELARKLAPADIQLDAVINQLQSPLAVCWYEKSRLSTPLFIARFVDETAAGQHARALGKLFDSVIGAHEFVRGERFPVEEQDADQAHYWSRLVSARYGSHLAGKEPFKEELSAARYFPVKLAIAGPYLFFSPDGSLVEQAVSVHQKRFPALADDLGDADDVVGYLNPATLASLLEREMYAGLPGQLEPLFRDAAKSYLAPRLQTLASYPPLTIRRDTSLQRPDNGLQWQPLDWQFVTP
jgi:uncharacterized protein YfaA (DUF2138 family)